MHETYLLKNLFKYLDREERLSSRRVKKIYVSLSEFGGISREHFRQHYKKESQNTKWKSLDIEIKRVSYGPELKITRLDFE